MVTLRSVDVFTTEIIRNGLASAAMEMNKTLRRTAYNPLLYDVQDFGVGIVSAEGLLWGDAPGQGLFVGALSETIRTGLAKRGLQGFEKGDILIANDPFLTGTHISDTSIYIPIYMDDELVAFSVATAHWADIGGKTPGGWCPDTTDVYQEGICFSHQRLTAGGVPNEDLWQVLMANVRFPETVRGDLNALIAACRLGSQRTEGLCVKYGAATVRAAMDLAINRAEEAVRHQIRQIPDGSYTASIAMDHDGVVKDHHPRVRVTITIAADRMVASFCGSSPATRGPINVTAIGARAAVKVAMKALLLPFDRTNEGHFHPIEFDLPPGLIVSAERPAPSDSYGYVITAVEELIFRALAPAIPDRCPAGGYQLVGLSLFRVDPRDGSPFILIDPADGGNGASSNSDGPTMMMFPNGDVPNTPVEVLESRYPVRCEQFRLNASVAGPGKFRGGMGTIRDYRLMEDGAFLQTITENTRDPIGRGAAGGGNGRASNLVIWPETERETVMKERVSFFGPLEESDVVRVHSAGGGGWGSPYQRDPAQVVRDVRDELVRVDEAASIYGVALDGSQGTWTVNQAETDRLRASR